MQVRLVLALGAAVAACVASPKAHASDEHAAARAEYDAAALAYDRQDFATAAARFAAADELVPSSRALQLAMTSALLAGSDPALGMNLVERADSRAVDGRLAELGTRLRRRFKSEATRLRIACPAGARCTAQVDGVEVDLRRPRWVTAGIHAVVVRAEGGASVERDVTAALGTNVDVMPSSSELFPPVAPPPPAPSVPDAAPASPPARAEPAATPDVRAGAVRESTPRRGPSPAFFWSGLAFTGVAAGAATVLTIASSQRHDEFIENRSPATAAAGDTAQQRAWLAWGVTGAFGVTTAVFWLLTDFKGERPATGSAHGLTVAAGPGSIVVGGRFR
jgi:hypothetical protein